MPPLVDLPGHPIMWPLPSSGIQGGSAPFNQLSTTLDASGETTCYFFKFTKAGNVAKIHFRTVTVTTGGTVNVTIEGVTSAGAPDDTPLTNGSTTVTIDSADDNVRKEAVFSPPCAVSQGQLVAVKIELSGAGSMQIMHTGNSAGQQFPHTGVETPTFGATVNAPNITIEFDDGSFAAIEGVYPCLRPTSATSVDMTTETTPDEAGVKFSLPFRCRISGVTIMIGGSLNSSTGDLILYAANGEVLQTVLVDEDLLVSGNWGVFLFDADVILEKDTVYRVALKATDASLNISLYYDVLSVAEHRAALQGGANFEYTERTDGGAWSESLNTRRPWIGFFISALDAG